MALYLDPSPAVSGRPLRLILGGLAPWTCFSAHALDPKGQPVQWTLEDEAFAIDQNGQPSASGNLCADGQGRAAWARLNTLDAEGQWTAQINIGPKAYSGKYALTGLSGQSTNVTLFNQPMRRYSGSGSQIYLAAGVPASMALDLSATLPAITASMRQWLTPASTEVPTIYVFADSASFRNALAASGESTNGLEAGIFRPDGPNRGIYMTMDAFNGQTVQVFLHEYAHLLVDQSAPRTEVPAWLNEGIATYLEHHVGAEFGAGIASRRDIYSSADEVRERQEAGALIPLSQLVSQKNWNTQADADILRLQYSEAYMAARYLVERSGKQAAFSILKQLDAGRSWEQAFTAVTGISPARFEQDWLSWVRGWQDPSRERVRAYMAGVQLILADAEDISAERGAFNQSSAGGGPFAGRVAAQTQFRDRAQALIGRAAALTTPEEHQGFQTGLQAFLTAYKTWLQTELDASTQSSNTLVEQANGMLPEVNARRFSVSSQASSIALAYVLS